MHLLHGWSFLIFFLLYPLFSFPFQNTVQFSVVVGCVWLHFAFL
ncbi:Protein CBG27555 [Caenorhabditis briggsae]|uniref:Protein CBG27555 n=1 Tax=Caenorhabditis briggsae TaxID=6238 RepID=B6IKL9_CAEBR|nr:Protein CBG27555 [Caenorhabditis briggsae]CAS00449.1 Protein CBG27555 [Caenorhabditis briggsae]